MPVPCPASRYRCISRFSGAGPCRRHATLATVPRSTAALRCDRAAPETHTRAARRPCGATARIAAVHSRRTCRRRRRRRTFPPPAAGSVAGSGATLHPSLGAQPVTRRSTPLPTGPGSRTAVGARPVSTPCVRATVLPSPPCASTHFRPPHRARPRTAGARLTRPWLTRDEARSGARALRRRIRCENCRPAPEEEGAARSGRAKGYAASTSETGPSPPGTSMHTLLPLSKICTRPPAPSATSRQTDVQVVKPQG